MNYFFMRFTPTKRLRRGRACSVGCAQQSCRARWSPRSRWRIKRKIRVLRERLAALLTSCCLPAATKKTFVGPNSSKRRIFRALFSVNESTLEESSCGDDVAFGGLVLLFAGFSLTRRDEVFSFWGCKSHFYGAELRRKGTGSSFSSRSPGTMRR